MKTMRDYLVCYNNLDVKPFVEAVEKMAQTYKDKGVDLFKDGISVPGLTLKYLFNISPDANFALFGNHDSDPYETYRNNLVGGLFFCSRDTMKRVKRRYVVVNSAKRYKAMTLMHCIFGP